MSKRVISDSTGLYKLNIVNKDKQEREQVDVEISNVVGNEPGPNSKQAIPQSPRKAPLKLEIQNDDGTIEQDDNLLKKIAKTQEEILQCESRLRALKTELKHLQHKLHPSIETEFENYKGDIGLQSPKRLSLDNRDKSLLSSPNSKWQQLKQNGNNLLQRFKDLALNEDEEEAYDKLVAQNRQDTSDRYRIRNSLNYEYNDSDESNTEEE